MDKGRARKEAKEGFTLVEIVVVVAVIGLIAAIAGSSMIRAYVNANEGAARAGLKAIQGGAISYRSTIGNYPATLAEMGSSYLSGGLEAGNKNGYNFVLQNGNNGATYTATAVPAATGFTGNSGFCTDAYNAIFIYQNAGDTSADGTACSQTGATVFSG
jgi:type IV pilus assembly protein PilA